MSSVALVVIAGMAAVTYFTRVSGLWFGGRMRPNARLDAVLAALPGAILVSLIAPGIVNAGIPGFIGAGVSVLVALRLRGNILFPMPLGLFTASRLRTS